MRHRLRTSQVVYLKQSCSLSNRKAPVAQLDRVLVSEAKGRGFDSRRARQLKSK